MNRPLVLALAALFACAPAALAAEDHPGTRNVLVTFDVGRIDDGEAVVLKTYSMLVRDDGEPIQMSTDTRIPIPVTSSQAEGGADESVPMTSFTYQRVGFSARLRARVEGHGAIVLSGRVEDSSLIETQTGGARPLIQSMDQNVSVTLRDGEPLRMISIEETDTRSFFIDVRAEMLDAATEVAAR